MSAKRPADIKTADNQLRICHLADAHLGYRRFAKLSKQGYNQREVDVSFAFREAIERIIALKPDVTIIAGDLFHSVRPSNSILVFCFREIKRLVAQTKAPCVVLAGNHEFPKRSDSGSPLKLLSEIDGIFVADAQLEKFTFPDLGLAVTCLPHAALTELESDALRADSRFKYNILVSHLQLDQGWQSDFGGVELKLRDLNVHEWDYVALGHIHVLSEFGLNAAYSGSLEHTSHNFWSEATHNKGFLEITLPECKRTFHAITSPRQVAVLDPIDCTGLTPQEIDSRLAQNVEQVAGGISGKLVRVELREIPREVQRQLDFKQIKKWKSDALHFGVEFRSPQASGIVFQARSGGGLVLEQELERFCKQWNFINATEDQVKDLIRGYMHKLEQQHEAT